MTPPGFQMQLSTLYIKTGTGEQPAAPGELLWGKIQPD